MKSNSIFYRLYWFAALAPYWIHKPFVFRISQAVVRLPPFLARISHTRSSRSGGRAGLSALRHARRYPLAGRGYPPCGSHSQAGSLC